MILAFPLAACSTDPSTTGDPPPVGTKPQQGPPPNVVGGFTAEIPPETLAPGSETEPCWILPMNIMGPSHIVGGAKLTAPPGMHHGNVTSRPITPGVGVRPCEGDDTGGSGLDVVQGGSVLFGSSTQLEGEEWYSFPEGMGYRVKDDYEIVARMHFLNPTGEEVVAAPKYEWFTIDEATVTQELAPFFWQYGEFEIPPLSSLTVTGECFLADAAVEHPMHIVTALPHMHALGRELFAEPIGGPFDGVRFVDSKGYDPENGVLVQFDPAVDLTQADGIRFGCTWDNTYDQTIVDGIGINEMCMVFGYSWPPTASYNLFASSATTSCLVLPTPTD